MQSLKPTLFGGKFKKMCHFCNTTPPKLYKILNYLLFSDMLPYLTCIYVLVKSTFGSSY